jgi:hypothetical protein
MFRLSEQHRSSLTSAAHEEFERRAVRALRKGLPSDVVPPGGDRELAALIWRCVPRAERYGLSTEFEAMCFVHAVCRLGENFDADPLAFPARILLTSRSIPPLAKAKQLLVFVETIETTWKRLGISPRREPPGRKGGTS